MSQTKCSYELCNKEIKKPILVTNYSFLPQKETYYACPYCLTRIDNTTESCHCKSEINTKSILNDEEKSKEIRKNQSKLSNLNSNRINKSILSQETTLEEIENLEQEKQQLIVELEKLKQDASKKINLLEIEVSNLKQEAEILKKITD